MGFPLRTDGFPAGGQHDGLGHEGLQGGCFRCGEAHVLRVIVGRTLFRYGLLVLFKLLVCDGIEGILGVWGPFKLKINGLDRTLHIPQPHYAIPVDHGVVLEVALDDALGGRAYHDDVIARPTHVRILKENIQVITEQS